jgi:hypothetical protein
MNDSDHQLFEKSDYSSTIAFEWMNLRVGRWEIGGNQITGGWKEIKKKQKNFLANYDVFFFKGLDPSWGISNRKHRCG